MDEGKLALFVEVTQRYFEKMGEYNVETDTPYLTRDINANLYEYTGMIHISGNHTGVVFFSTMALTAIRLLHDMDVPSSDPEKLLDLVGEISNTIAGNTRVKFGKDFLLKPPVLIHGEYDHFEPSVVVDTYVVPLSWAKYKSNLIVQLNTA